MKILYVTTISSTINAFLIPHIKMLIEEGHNVDLAFNNDNGVKQELIELGCKVYEVPFQRSPLKLDNLIAYKKIRRIIFEGKYDLVHTHTPIASAIVRLVCRKLNNIRVFYTAHGFHFYRGAPILNWLVYYPIEKILAKYTDVLITINKEDYLRAKKSFKAGQIKYVPGVGLDIKKFNEIIVDKAAKRKELSIPNSAFMILSVGELNKNKNHETVIRAIAKLNNPNIYYLICGVGKLENKLHALVKDLGLEKQVKLIGYRTDIAEICKASDIFCFPSYREGLSVALMEAMAVGLPIVCSNIRGNVDLIKSGKGGFLVNPNDIDGYAEAISKLIKNKELCIEFGKYNIEAVKKYNLDVITDAMKKIYKQAYDNRGI